MTPDAISPQELKRLTEEWVCLRQAWRDGQTEPDRAICPNVGWGHGCDHGPHLFRVTGGGGTLFLCEGYTYPGA
jgi:hypothetical protein